MGPSFNTPVEPVASGTYTPEPQSAPLTPNPGFPVFVPVSLVSPTLLDHSWSVLAGSSPRTLPPRPPPRLQPRPSAHGLELVRRLSFRDPGVLRREVPDGPGPTRHTGTAPVKRGTRCHRGRQFTPTFLDESDRTSPRTPTLVETFQLSAVIISKNAMEGVGAPSVTGHATDRSQSKDVGLRFGEAVSARLRPRGRGGWVARVGSELRVPVVGSQTTPSPLRPSGADLAPRDQTGCPRAKTKWGRVGVAGPYGRPRAYGVVPRGYPGGPRGMYPSGRHAGPDRGRPYLGRAFARRGGGPVSVRVSVPVGHGWRGRASASTHPPGRSSPARPRPGPPGRPWSIRSSPLTFPAPSY